MRKRKPNGQSIMDRPETQAILGTNIQNEDKQNTKYNTES